MSMEDVVRNDEEILRVKVRTGYVLQIGGDFYQEGETITTKYKNVKQQEWKVEIIGSSNSIPRKSARPEVIVEEVVEEKVIEEENILSNEQIDLTDDIFIEDDKKSIERKTARVIKSKK